MKSKLSNYTEEELLEEISNRKLTSRVQPGWIEIKFPLGRHIEAQDIFDEIEKYFYDNYTLNDYPEFVNFYDKVVDNTPNLYGYEIKFEIQFPTGNVRNFVVRKVKK